MSTNNAINSNIPIEISKGGTNATSMATTDGIVYFDGTRLVTTAAGSSGEVLTSNGAGMAPTFQAAAGGSPTGFYAYRSAGLSNVTGDGTTYTIPFDATFYNDGTMYNTGTGIATIPTTGRWVFTVNVLPTGMDQTPIDYLQIQLVTNGTVSPFIAYANNSSLSVAPYWVNVGGIILTGTVEVPLTAGDLVHVAIEANGSGGSLNVSISAAAGAFTYFQGRLG